MTPQERQLVDDLFDRLAKLESAPRDAEAEAAIADGLRRAPHALYALVQTVLVQDEALKQAEARIQELEQGGAPQSGSFLDTMRDALFGAPAGARGSVPNVRSPDTPRPVWNAGPGGDPRYGAERFAEPPRGGGGGSFLGTAAAAAAGVIGGSMLMNSLRGLMGGGHGQAFGNDLSGGPWGSGGRSGGDDLAREAGLDDIGRSGGEQRQSLADNARYDDADNAFDDADGDDDFDGDDFDSGDSDYA